MLNKGKEEEEDGSSDDENAGGEGGGGKYIYLGDLGIYGKQCNSG